MKVRFMLPAALLAVGVAAYAQDAVTLARKFKEGDVIRFKTVLTANVMGTEAVATSISKQTVKKIHENGEVTVGILDEGTKLALMGQEQELPSAGEAVETRDKNGRIKKLELPAGSQEFMTPEIRQLTSILAEPMLGEKAVKSGDAWTAEVENPAVKGKKVAFKNSYLGVDKVGDVAAWKIKQTAEAVTDAQGAKITADNLYWLDPADGSVLKSESKVEGVPTQFGTMSWVSKVERAKAEDKKA